VPAVPNRIRPTIVLSQFAATSLWFAGNAVMPDLQRSAGLPASAVGDITIAVQLGFIAGTLVFAWLAIADRYSPRIVFFLSALAGAAANAATLMSGEHGDGGQAESIEPPGRTDDRYWTEQHVTDELRFQLSNERYCGVTGGPQRVHQASFVVGREGGTVHRVYCGGVVSVLRADSDNANMRFPHSTLTR